MRAAMLIGLSLLAVIAPAAAWSGENLSGRASVIDGDTLSVRGKVIGLYGVAAPSLKQDCLDASSRSYSCGAASARALAAHISTAIITCETLQPIQNGRILATCRKSKEDLSAWMVMQGHATADRRVSTAYVQDERQAWAKRQGLWAGVFDDPASRERAPYSAMHQFVAAQPDDRTNEPSTTSSVKR
ncbi:thermonuclease family protein [Methylobacterium nigriterrae]|uniref:thermonuclease family protein n=1 Tax=Methylobacterium nigriterrae TaxID=3127512 RepID=UPI003013F31F